PCPANQTILARNHPHLPTTPSVSQPEFSGLKRSERSRRPSARKIESDEYEASSRGSSRPTTPSTRTSKPKSKKRPHGKRGNRHGHITQPTHVGTAGDSFSLEPATTTGPLSSNSDLAPINTSNRSVAIRYMTDILGLDTAHLSTRMLRRILDSHSAYTETNEPGSMGPSGASAPAIMQSAQRMVLDAQSTSQTSALSRACIPPMPKKPTATLGEITNDTMTESESESECVELGPKDSVSQHIAHPTPSPFTLYRLNHSRPTKNTLPPGPGATLINEPPSEAETDPDFAVSGPESCSDLDTAPAPKRPRLPNPHDSNPRNHHTGRHVATPSSQACSNGVRGLSTTTFGTTLSKSTPGQPTTHTRSASANGGRPLKQNQNQNSLPQPPPPSDLSAILTWALQMARQASTSTTATREEGSASQPGETYGLLAKVIEGLQVQLAAFKLVDADPGSQQPPNGPGDMDFVEDDAEMHEAEARRNHGKNVDPKRKVGLDDFPGINRRIASLAIPEFLAMTFTRGPYEVNATLVDWGYEAFKLVSHHLQHKEPYQKPPRELVQLVSIVPILYKKITYNIKVVHRVSWYHGELKKFIRSKIETEYGFINPPRTHEECWANHQLAK
ncbi:hypothetical protein FRC11_011071, partial [Ceratobasidium sp. 423]